MDSLLKTFENWVTTKIDERLALTGYTKSDELIAKDKELGILQRDYLDLLEKRIDALDDHLEVHAKHFNNHIDDADKRVDDHAKHLTENTNAIDAINDRFKVHAKHFNDNFKTVESLEHRFEDLEQQCSEAVTKFEIFDINDHVDFTEAVTYEIEQLDLTDYIDRGRIVDEIEDSFRISISADIIRKS